MKTVFGFVIDVAMFVAATYLAYVLGTGVKSSVDAVIALLHRAV